MVYLDDTVVEVQSEAYFTCIQCHCIHSILPIINFTNLYSLRCLVLKYLLLLNLLYHIS